MRKEDGDKRFPIWLLGDSNPQNWQDFLAVPLDARHPARHNIWTPVLEVVQDQVFRTHRNRIETSSIYVRNAIELSTDKPVDNKALWNDKTNQEILLFRQDLSAVRPKIIFSFGAFAFEFARRALAEDSAHYPYRNWTTECLGQEFVRRVADFDLQKINLLPLLHATIARGQFLKSHHNFCNGGTNANYFSFVGGHIARTLIAYHDQLPIWIQ